MVFIVADNQSGLLQELDDGVRLFVNHVSPFMALVSQNPDNHCEDYHPVASLGKEGS